MKKTLLAATIAAISATAFAAPVNQGTGSDTMAVTVTLTEACADITANDIDFGTHFATNKDVDIPVIVNVTCQLDTPYTVELDYGINVAATSNIQRQVANIDTTEFMDYDIFQPDASGAAATVLPWGDAANGQEYASTGTGAEQDLVATGRVHIFATKTPGTYTDLVTVTLNY